MKHKARAWMVIVLLVLPISYLAVRDVEVRIRIAGDWLVQKQMTYHTKIHVLRTEGEDEGGRACTITFNQPGRMISPTYPVPCDVGSEGYATVRVVPGIFSDEVITFDGVQIWRGEPSENQNWLTVPLYTASYLAVLYFGSLALLRRWPAMRVNPFRTKGLALVPMFFGGAGALFGVLGLEIFWGDPMLGMLIGALVAAATCLRQGFREPPPAVVSAD